MFRSILILCAHVSECRNVGYGLIKEKKFHWRKCRRPEEFTKESEIKQIGACGLFCVVASTQNGHRRLPSLSETRVCFFFFFCWVDRFVSFCLQKSPGNYKTATPNTKIKYITEKEKQPFLYWCPSEKTSNF